MSSHYESNQEAWIEGISNEVLYFFFFIILLILICYIIQKMFRSSRDIHPHHLERVQEIRQRVLETRGEEPRPNQRRNAEDRCPICIDHLSFAVETNCAHVFCCKYILYGI